MEQHYKLFRIRELSGDDQEFIQTLVATFLEEVPEDARQLEIAVDSRDHLKTYKVAHKMKPTVDLFELGVLDELIQVQDWGKFEQKDDISEKLVTVMTAINNTIQELKADFNL
jgi:HPt (histidine-containing phosphotransfer) domain-containing protein